MAKNDELDHIMQSCGTYWIRMCIYKDKRKSIIAIIYTVRIRMNLLENIRVYIYTHNIIKPSWVMHKNPSNKFHMMLDDYQHSRPHQETIRIIVPVSVSHGSVRLTQIHNIWWKNKVPESPISSSFFWCWNPKKTKC